MGSTMLPAQVRNPPLRQGENAMGWMMGGPGFGFGTFGLLGGMINLVVTVGLLVVIVLSVVWLARSLSLGGGTRSGRVAAGTPSPHEILQARYARGEITREQFQGMLSDLS
jgi:putative membrane protein